MPRLRHPSVLAVLLCGVALPLLWVGSRTTGFKCGICDHVFYRRTIGARICLILFVTTLALLLSSPYLLYELRDDDTEPTAATSRDTAP